MKIWECKIGEVDAAKLPPGADLPMRIAIQRAYKELTGEEANFLFSGWGGKLDECERFVVDAKDYDAVLQEALIIDVDGGTIAVGYIYGDKKGRFRDGTSIRTSYVLEGPNSAGIIRTRNSTYKVELAGA